MTFNVKIDESKVTTRLHPQILMDFGYRRVSNAYCEIARIDRPDWLDVLATQLGCAVADFYNKDGSGVSGSWCDYYRRMHSKDVHVVSPTVIGQIKSSGHDPVGYVEKKKGVIL